MQKLITRLIISAALTLVLLGAPGKVTGQVRTLNVTALAGGIVSGNIVQTRATRITFSRVSWTLFLGDPPTSCSFKIEQSDTGLTGTFTDLTAPIDCSSEGKFEFITPALNQVLRFTLVSLEGIGNGVLEILWEGFRGEGCGIDYRGVFSVVSSPDPAAGEELSIGVPDNERWRVYSASFDLQADSVMADREVFLTASKGSDEYFRTFADGVVKADQKGIFTTAPIGFVGTAGLGPSSINQPTDVRTIMIPIYSEAFIPGGHTLATATNGIQSGDNYSPAVVLTERCPN